MYVYKTHLIFSNQGFEWNLNFNNYLSIFFVTNFSAVYLYTSSPLVYTCMYLGKTTYDRASKIIVDYRGTLHAALVYSIQIWILSLIAFMLNDVYFSWVLFYMHVLTFVRLVICEIDLVFFKLYRAFKMYQLRKCGSLKLPWIVWYLYFKFS